MRSNAATLEVQTMTYSKGWKSQYALQSEISLSGNYVALSNSFYGALYLALNILFKRVCSTGKR